MAVWVCEKCGVKVEGRCRPQKCSKCGAGKDAFKSEKQDTDKGGKCK